MKIYDWSRERVEKAVRESNCYFNCLENLGIPKRGCNYRTLKNKIKLYGLNIDHFSSKYRTVNGKHSQRLAKNKSDEEIFCDSPKMKNSTIKREYIRRVLVTPRCEGCEITDWNGKPLEFQLHHIDGNSKNNKLENLKLLCPNCHSQTDNYANKKRKKG